MGWSNQYLNNYLKVINLGTWEIDTNIFVVPVDFSPYQSIFISAGYLGYGGQVRYWWTDSNGNPIDQQHVSYFGPGDGRDISLPVVGPTLNIYADSAQVPINIYGLNVPAIDLMPPWGAQWIGTATPTSGVITLSLEPRCIPPKGSAHCFLQCYPLPSGDNRVQVQLQSNSNDVPNLVILDTTVSGTGIFANFTASFPDPVYYTPVVHLYPTLTQNCPIILDAFQDNI